MEEGPHYNGFTLIELVVTVLVMGVLSGILIPFSVEAISKSQLESAARIITSDIRYGENKALTEQCDTFKIIFISASNEYRKYFDKNNPTKYESVKIPQKVILSSAVFGTQNPRVYINSRGTVVVGGSVSLTDNYGNWNFVRVAPITGRVRIERIRD